MSLADLRQPRITSGNKVGYGQVRTLHAANADDRLVDRFQTPLVDVDFAARYNSRHPAGARRPDDSRRRFAAAFGARDECHALSFVDVCSPFPIR